ncbi:CHRD domain-containing protein [Arthrobacter sp. R1-13]
MLNAHSTRFRAMAVLAAVTALATANVGAATAAPFGDGAAIPLNVGQETPAPNSRAHGFFSYEIVNGEFCYRLRVQNLSADVSAAHIHIAPRNMAGPVVIPLEVGKGTSWNQNDCTLVDSTLLAAIEANPRDYYVNVHTIAVPSGEIRGQLK